MRRLVILDGHVDVDVLGFLLEDDGADDGADVGESIVVELILVSSFRSPFLQ